MKNALSFLTALLLAPLAATHATEFHVSTSGSDSNPGTQAAPLRTIQHAADLAQPEDVITVHEGVYRERINPPRGGESDAKRIVYQAAPGEKVAIKGSEEIKNWVHVQDAVWKTTLPNAFFGSFNPYSDLLRGDWFRNKNDRHDHTGAVYLNGEWYAEAASLDEVLTLPATTPLWFGRVDKETTTLWAQFKGINPNKQRVEINARQTVFYPEKTGINYITVRGFTMCHAATPWAPPTAEQIGLIGTHWSKGWIIENNAISHSMCSGISLGKYGDEWDNKAMSAEGFVKTVDRARENGWSKETVGHHIVRDNVISDCEQAGIIGSLGAVFSTINGNTIHDIHVRMLFGGDEMAGIKIHAAIDMDIRHNHIYRSWIGLWLDWMAQGTRVSGNLLHENGWDLFVEVNHGPVLVDNNLSLSPVSLVSRSQGSAFAHNLFAGDMNVYFPDSRVTPFHKAHSTELAGMRDNPCGDDRYYNNLFVELSHLSPYDSASLPVWMDGNVFFKGAKPSKHEANPLILTKFDPAFKLREKKGRFYLEGSLGKALATERTRKLVTTALLGRASIPDAPFEDSDGTPIRVDTDYFGKQRNEANPMPGPFEKLPKGKISVRVW